jgi:tRNA (Thr-GGU) A37 N-methylase
MRRMIAGAGKKRITLTPGFTAEALQGPSGFSHIEVLFQFTRSVRQPAWSHELLRQHWIEK